MRGTSDEPLVGRLAEMRWLRHRLDLAEAGKPQCVLVVGEAGIGKTRIAHEVQALAVAQGFEPLAGRAFEDVRLPLLPLRDDVLPALVAHCEQAGRAPPAALTTEPLDPSDPAQTGPGAGIATHVFLELATLLLDAAARSPRFVLLDDLHWADPASINLVRHVVYRIAGHLPPTRLMLLATGRRHPALVPLEREYHCAVLELRPLDALEAADLARRLGTRRALPGASLAATGGNPLAIEIAAAAGLAAPVGARAGVLDRLPIECREVLPWVAVLVPDATPDALAALDRWDGSTLSAAIGTALAAEVLVEDGRHLLFAHPELLRECLAWLDPLALRRAHLAAARASDPATGRTSLCVARHLVAAGTLADPAEVARVTEVAAREAMRVCAWEEAAELFEAAIAAHARLPRPGAGLAELHCLVGDALLFALDDQGASKHYEIAGELSAANHDAAVELRARDGYLRARSAVGPVGASEVAAVASLAEALVEQEPALAGEALVDVSQAEWLQLRIAQARGTIDRALRLAERFDLPGVAAKAYQSRAITDWMTLDLPAALDALRRAETHALESEDPLHRVRIVYRLPLTLLWLGDVAAAEVAARDATELGEMLHYQYEYVLVLAARIGIAALRGEHAAVEDLTEQALRLQRLSGYQWAAALYLPVLALAHLERGEVAQALVPLDAWEDTADQMSRIPLRLLRDVVAVRSRQAGAEVLARLPPLPDTPMLATQDWAVLAIELAVRLGQPAAAVEPLALVESTLDRGMRVSSSLARLLDRAAADGHALLGHADAARVRYDAAIDLADRIGAPVEGAFARLGLARLLRRHERSSSARYLRAALPVLEQHALAPALAEADALARVLGTDVRSVSAGDDEQPVSEIGTVLFFDVVESTRLTEELGDVGYWRRARALESRLRAVVAQSGGTALPGVNVGDGLLALFPSPGDALAAALNGVDAAVPTELRLHVGLHHGPVLRRGDALYGATVNFAARACSVSGTDEVLVSERARDLLSVELDTAVAFVDRGNHDLKGIEAPQRLFAAVAPG